MATQSELEDIYSVGERPQQPDDGQLSAGNEAVFGALGVAMAAAIIGAIWYAMAWADPRDQSPALTSTWRALVTNDSAYDFWDLYFQTIFQVLLGWFGGVVLGVPIGQFVGTSQRLRRLFDPLFTVMRFVVPIALSAVWMEWIDLGTEFIPTLVTASLPLWFAADVVARSAANSRRTDQRAKRLDGIQLLRVTLLLAFLTAFLGRSGLIDLLSRGLSDSDLHLVMTTILAVAITGSILDYGVRLLGRRIESVANEPTSTISDT